ncbi:hypothetical protein [Sodalis sp.]|uniref:hypothetical protein n=1 Tax=Sodalis sp. (in: enterobacteria) TaxID=1898979 RepID=UPI0038730791
MKGGRYTGVDIDLVRAAVVDAGHFGAVQAVAPPRLMASTHLWVDPRFYSTLAAWVTTLTLHRSTKRHNVINIWLFVIST